MIFTSKHKLIIAVAGVFAVIALAFALILFREPMIPDEVKVLDMTPYEHAIHSMSENGLFPTDIIEFADKLNEHLPEAYTVAAQTTYIDGNLLDDNDYPIMIVPVANNMVEIISIGKDGKLNTSDDNKSLVFTSIVDSTAIIKTIPYFDCSHTFSSKIIKDVSCTQSGVEQRLCSSCNSMETVVQLALGHRFTDESCASINECIVCGETSAALGHTFAYMDRTEPYIAVPGTCTIPAQYYFRCLYCKEKDVRTYTYVNQDNHLSLKEEKLSLDENTMIHRLSCNECHEELISAVVRGHKAIYGGTAFKPTIYTLNKVLYSLDGVEYTTQAPSFDEPGISYFYYKVEKGEFSLTGSIEIELQDRPIISIDQFNHTSFNEPYVVESAGFILTGIVTDSNGIKEFKINDVNVPVDANGRWEYEGYVDEAGMVELIIKAVDNQEYSTTEFHYIATEIIDRTPATSVDIIHTSEKYVTISGQIKNMDMFSLLTVDDVPVYVNEEGYWSVSVASSIGNVKNVKIVIVSKDAHKVGQVIQICHCNTEPTIGITNFTENTISGSISDNFKAGCSTIDSIRVYGIEHLNGVTLKDCDKANIVDGTSIIVYQHESKDMDMIDVSIDFNQYVGVKHFELLVKTTHGQEMLYKFDLTWNNGEVTVVTLTTINVVTGNESTMTIPVSLFQ